jgi:hypothetical protein
MNAMAKGRDKRKRSQRKTAAQAPKIDARPGDPPAGGDADPLVRAPLKPKPHLRSGAIALSEPENAEIAEKPASRSAA